MQTKLTALNLPFVRENCQPLAKSAVDKHWSHIDCFTALLNGEATARADRRVQRCIAQAGADCLFQTISHRYERGATTLTTHRVFKQWAAIFNHDAVLTSAQLDLLLHHAETVLIEGKSYRANAQVEVSAVDLVRLPLRTVRQHDAGRRAADAPRFRVPWAA